MADLSTENGISKKIIQQSEAWLEAGMTVRLFTQSHLARTWRTFSKVPVSFFSKGLLWERYRQSLALTTAVDQWQPDLIYFRYAYHAPGLPALFRRFPTVAEINSDDRREYTLTLGPAKQLYHRLTRNRILRPVAGFVTVTHELSRVLDGLSPARITIGNSIPLASTVFLPEKLNHIAPRLLFIGTAGSPWHGLERLAELAALFPTWRFDVVGLTAHDWHKQTGLNSTSENIQLHGPLRAHDYAALLPHVDAAIGSLALFKNGMHEACPLKVREYLALGLPVIGACADTDIPDQADYYLRLPNDAAPLAPHRETIAAFVQKWQGRRVPRASIAHLDTSVKEAARLSFMARILANWRTLRPI